MKRALIAAAACLMAVPLLAQGPGAAPRAQGGAAPRAQATPQPAPPNGRASAPVDLTGYWVSLITEDWRWRMIMPARGDYQSVPITAEAKQVADAWDPAKDEAAGEQCRAYGAAGLMRLPTRLHITWADENTLKVESDAGQQTRLLRFTPSRSGGRPGWQGDSIATWDSPRQTGETAPLPLFGSLTVVTTNMRPGYLRKNGVPYSAAAKMTEYWDIHKGRTGEQWLVISTTIEDPKYLQVPWMTSPNFKREPDGSKWDPTPCNARK